MRSNSLIGLAALLLLALGPAWAQDTVMVEDHGNGRYTLTTTLAATTNPEHGQLAIVPKAEELCGERFPHYGRYEFESISPIGGDSGAATTELRYIQDIECLETPEQSTEDPSNAVPPAPDTPPTADDEALIRNRTLEYLRAKIAADAGIAYTMLSDTMRSYASPEEWSASQAAFNTQAGPGAEPTVVRLSWYDNPPGAPVPGRYVAADYRVDYPSSAFTCGYLVWLRQADGTYLAVREETGKMTPDVMAKLTPEQKSMIRIQLQCRD
jgi:hypothetical protein